MFYITHVRFPCRTMYSNPRKLAFDVVYAPLYSDSDSDSYGAL